MQVIFTHKNANIIITRSLKRYRRLMTPQWSKPLSERRKRQPGSKKKERKRGERNEKKGRERSSYGCYKRKGRRKEKMKIRVTKHC